MRIKVSSICLSAGGGFAREAKGRDKFWTHHRQFHRRLSAVNHHHHYSGQGRIVFLLHPNLLHSLILKTR